jgi:flagellar basal-body rod protein FlgB
MFEKLHIFRLSSAMAAHAGQRQAVVAQNVANADTPGFVARDIPSFATLYRDGAEDGLRATRAGHLHGGGGGAIQPARIVEAGSDGAPNGNRVSIEAEMLKSTDALRQHDRALAIYRSALGILRSAAGA